MSQENIESVRRAYDVAFVQRSVEGIRELLADDFNWHQRAEWPGQSVYRAEDVPQLWADLDDTYSEFNVVPVEFVDVGDSVIVTVETTTRLRTSTARIAGRLWHVWHIRDGLLRDVRVYGTDTQAMEAAGRDQGV